jgi:hypothetical protein
MKTTYTTELGKCHKATSDGRFRAYKDNGLFQIYLCGKEMKFDAEHNFVGYGKRMEATATGVHFRDIDNFDAAVYEVQCELNWLAKEGA